MSSCGSCRSGRCGDFSSKAVGLPSLAAIDVVERILLQAVKNTAQRSVDVSEGKLSRQDLVDADLKLVTWLTDTFAGRNRHFETAEGWNPTGLAQYLREGMGERVRDVLGGKLPDGDYEMIEIGARLFLNNAYVLLEQIGLMGNGNLSGLEQNDSVLAFVNYWSCLLTGCPFADD